MVSTATSAGTITAVANGGVGCSECQNVKNEVKAVREQLNFLTHQIALLMRFLSVGCCRCSTCDSYLSSSGADSGMRSTSASADLQTVNGCDQYLHPSYGQLLAALRLQTQQDCMFQPADGTTANETPTSPSSLSCTADKSAIVDNAAEASSSQVAKKRRGSSLSGTTADMDEGPDAAGHANWSKMNGTVDDEYFRMPKRRIVCVDQLLPKLFAGTQANGPTMNGSDADVGRNDSDGLVESPEPSSKETPKRSSSEESTTLRSTTVDSATRDETEIRPTLNRAPACHEHEKVDKATPEDQAVFQGGINRDFATPPAVLMPTPKERFLMSFLHRPQPMLYPFGQFGLTAGKSALAAPLAVGCCSPPFRQMSRLQCFKTLEGSAAVVERPRSLNDESPCSSNGGGGVELPKTCVDVPGRNGFESMYPHRNGLLLTSGQVLPTSSIASSTFVNDTEHHLKGFSATGPPMSAALPLVTQGPRMSTFYCTICNRDFSNVYYKRHMIVHANARPYICDVCGKRFNERSNMMKHKQRLHGP